MLVTRILGDCPGCKKPNAYGNVDVFGAVLIRGCGYCKYEERIYLPDVTKSIIYLDQYFHSLAFRQEDARFIDAEKRISEVAHQQLLVAPYSSLHEQETLLWKRHEELREFIRKTARGHKFAPQYQVERIQVTKAFNAWRKDESESYDIEEDDVLRNDIHKWQGYFYVSVRGYQLDPEDVRASKKKSIENLVGIFDDWRKSTSKIDQDIGFENQGAAKAYSDAYTEYVARMVAGDPNAFLETPIRAVTIESIMMALKSKEADVEKRLRMCGDFLQSGHFKNIPFNWLSSRMFAVLKDMVRNGAYPNDDKAKEKLSGFFYDVNHIATYAPYCDAIVIDAGMAELVSHPAVNLEKDFGVRVFSPRNWDDLLAWVESLKKGITSEHQAALDAIHAKKK